METTILVCFFCVTFSPQPAGPVEMSADTVLHFGFRV